MGGDPCPFSQSFFNWRALFQSITHYISLEWTLDAELRALIIIAISKVVFIPIYLFDRCSMSESASLRAVVPN